MRSKVHKGARVQLQGNERPGAAAQEFITKFREQRCHSAKLFAWKVLLSSRLQPGEREGKKNQPASPTSWNHSREFSYLRAEEMPDEELLDVHEMGSPALVPGSAAFPWSSARGRETKPLSGV